MVAEVPCVVLVCFLACQASVLWTLLKGTFKLRHDACTFPYQSVTQHRVTSPQCTHMGRSVTGTGGGGALRLADWNLGATTVALFMEVPPEHTHACTIHAQKRIQNPCPYCSPENGRHSRGQVGVRAGGLVGRQGYVWMGISAHFQIFYLMCGNDQSPSNQPNLGPPPHTSTLPHLAPLQSWPFWPPF